MLGGGEAASCGGYIKSTGPHWAHRQALNPSEHFHSIVKTRESWRVKINLIHCSSREVNRS
jgi:hypothetical protein